MPKRVLQARKLITWTALCAVLATGLFVAAPLRAQEPSGPAKSLHVIGEGQNAVISLGLPAGELAASELAAAVARELPIERFGGYELPMQYVTLALSSGSTPLVQVQELEATEIANLPNPAAPELPPALDLEPHANVAA